MVLGRILEVGCNPLDKVEELHMPGRSAAGVEDAQGLRLGDNWEMVVDMVVGVEQDHSVQI